MTRTLHGDRIGKQGKLRLGCSAVLFDARRERILLTQRADNGEWCLPGGMLEPGESAAEGCAREVFEETGLRVQVLRLTGVYSDPDQLAVYPDGNAVQIVALNFEVEAIAGKMGLSDETTDIQYIPPDRLAGMAMFSNHRVRVQDALAGQEAAFIR